MGCIRYGDPRLLGQLRDIAGAHGSGLWSVCASPDCSHIISGSFYNTVKVWDELSGDAFERMHRRKPFVTIVDWLNRLDDPPALPVVLAFTSAGIITKKIAQFI